jgi:hypothetical protein
MIGGKEDPGVMVDSTIMQCAQDSTDAPVDHKLVGKVDLAQRRMLSESHIGDCAVTIV